MKYPRTFRRPLAALTALLLLGAAVAPGRMVRDTEVDRTSGLDEADREASKSLIMHDIGNVRMTLSNWGETGNPDGVPGLRGFEFPINSGNDFLFSAGIWVGAVVDGLRLVSTATDGDNGTNEFYPVHIQTAPFTNAPDNADWFVYSKSLSRFEDKDFVTGAKGVDDDGDWTSADDQDGNGRASANYDGGRGLIGVDDDRDGSIDEEIANGTDDDADGAIDEDTDATGDANRDGNCNYDPEAHVDEDPPGDISHDYFDNDYDGLVDLADPDADGDAAPGLFDDDGDGESDEDANARGVEEYYTVFQDDIEGSFVGSPDSDGHTPLRITVTQRSYAFPEEYAADFILLDYRIRNNRPLPLENVYIGMFSDPDIGAIGEGGDAASLDDLNYYDPRYLMMIQYDDPNDADGPGPGIFAIRVVQTPSRLEDLRVTFANFERTAGGDPDNNANKYNLISSGNISPPTAQMGDWRMLMAFGDSAENGFTIQPGEELPITVAFIAGSDTTDGAKNADWARRIYLNDFQGPSSPNVPEFELDVYSDMVRVRWLANAEQSQDVISERFDFEGYVVERSTDQNIWQTVAAYDIQDRLDTVHVTPDSFYVDPARWEFEWQHYNLGMPEDSDTPGDTVTLDGQLWYFVEDRNLVPGHSYYYTVRAFDKGEPGAGILYTSRTGNVQQAIMARTAATGATSDMNGIYVFPNPYRGSHQGEASGQDLDGLRQYPRQIYFRGLPPNVAQGQCMIRIYSLAGDYVAAVDHYNGTEQNQWDLITRYDQEIASGIYYYIVEYNGKQFIDKFVVIK